MKILIIAILMVPAFSIADVTIHTNKFDAATQTSGEHFWARLYDWSAWERTSEQRAVDITANPVKSAYDMGLGRVDAGSLSKDDFENVFGSYEAWPLNDFYVASKRREIDGASIESYKGLVTYSSISVPYSKGLDISLEEMSSMIIQADEPHFHSQVSGEFVSKFIDPVHTGHQDISDGGDFYMSMINMGDELYNCDIMNGLISFYAETQGVSIYDDRSYRLYMINRIKELDRASIESLSDVISEGAVRVFEQKIIYASNLLKSGVNYFSLYETENGPRLVMTSVLVSTSLLQTVSSTYLNGFPNDQEGIGEDYLSNFDKIEFNDGIGIVSSENVATSSIDEVCQKGLGQGIASYVYNLANKVAN